MNKQSNLVGEITHQIEIEEQNNHKQDNQYIQQQINKVEQEEDEDDWDPSPPKKENTILNKLKVNFTNKEIKFQGENHFRDVVFDQGEFADFDEEELNDYYAEEQKDQNDQENKPQKRNGENIDFDDEEVQVDDKNRLFQDNKEAIKKLRKQIQMEDVFFNPIQDEEDDVWVKQNLKSDLSEKTGIILSCPCCFVQLSYDSQRHEFYDNQYRSICVKNVKINTSKIIQPTEEDNEATTRSQMKSKFRKNKRKQQKNKKEQAQNTLVIHEDDDLANQNLEELEQQINKQKDLFLIYFSAECLNCSTEVAAYELNEKVYHFFNVIPSLG
ncbi:E2F-associated phosphoprotein (macronuclear) [Tetrahymena thermophila SB210]|uniref:E2F-associated phosphoprotein n=1 Tax=Tetrahymena thermophila (strain SB210) TaxID=312017 RepID=I7LXA4_TETTS|nr:E2F-associated phosphoprotein [Tetrahymena thermophila SB210]EAS04259.2 E2F-associated phosphoprotein [Tetrahymena thermophila SB210]|eukprot:XP_001024504.2 E2F-associated phosphoprotein [Tetrahymena thermophila SB210]